MRRILLAALLTIATASAAFTQIPQTRGRGEISGHLTDRENGPLPGVRVLVKGGDHERREVITDTYGRFLLSGLTLGRYQVDAELHGFRPASGAVTLSEAIPRAHLAWALDVGCLSNDLRVKMEPREAASRVDTMAHVRVTSADGPLTWSTRPECEGKTVESYSATVLRRVKGKASRDEGALQLLLNPTDARLKSGAEYVALLWTGGFTDDSLLLPVESGRVVASVPEPLGGMPVEQALKTLSRWAFERRP